MKPDAVLPARSVLRGIALARTTLEETAPVTPASPAVTVMTDLTQTRAVTVHPTLGLRQAEQLMAHEHVHMLFVVSDVPLLHGLITSNDLHGERVMRAVRERDLHYEDLCVADAMTPVAMLDAIDYAQIRFARVSNVVATFQKHARNHLLVVETGAGEGPDRVRGIVSRARLEQQLGTVIEASGVARGVEEIGQALS